MAAIRLMSDIHSEFSPLDLPFLDGEADDILILAGDIGLVDIPRSFDVVKTWIARFRHTIMIRGNHEFYRGSFISVPNKQKQIFAAEITSGKLSLLENEMITIDDISFIGATLWTDFNNFNPVTVTAIKQCLNDYRAIRTGTQSAPYKTPLAPLDILNAHQVSKNYIFPMVKTEKAKGRKVIVVTHHAPSTLSIHPMYGNDPINWAYASDLSQEILDSEPDLMVHGHTHTSFDYIIGNTRVIANPRGYCNSPNGVPENKQFDPLLRIVI